MRALAVLLALGSLQPLFAKEPEPRFAAADQAFRERKDPARAYEALKMFRELYKATPNDPEAGWRLGFACYFVGIRLTKENKDKRMIYAEGRDAALHAAALDDSCAACHFWGAINLVLYGQAVGVFKTYFSLGEVKKHLKASLKDDPTYAYGGAYRLLGQIDHFLPRILGGSRKRAKGYYEQAIQVAPGEPLNYLFLARLLDSLREKDAALDIAKKGLGVPAPAPERLEAIDALEDLKTFVKDKGG
jgi:tetratricopeptide (TPR) repeat protein